METKIKVKTPKTSSENENGSADAGRSSFLDPGRIVARLDFKSGQTVADFGTGTGYFAFAVARKIGQEGKLYAFDIRNEKLEAVSSQAKLSGVTNIITKQTNLERDGGSGLAKESCDWVLVVNMLFQNKNKGVILEEAKRVVKNDGKIMVIEWNERKAAFGPSEKIKVPREKMIRLANESGLKVVGSVDVSDYHYGMILTK